MCSPWPCSASSSSEGARSPSPWRGRCPTCWGWAPGRGCSVGRCAGRRERGGPATGWVVLAREFWAYTAPRAIARVTQTALKRSDIVLVAALASPADAALYTAATRFVVVGQLFVQSVQQALSPHLSTLFAQGETQAANSVFQAATLWSMIASWPLYLVTAGFATELMAIFGEGYEVASDVVVILSLTMLLATACGPVDSVLLMAGRSWLSLRNSVVALVVNVGLNVVLIPLDGIRGAAIAWAVAIVVRNLLPLVQVRKHLGMWPLRRAAGVRRPRRGRQLRRRGRRRRRSPRGRSRSTSDWSWWPRRCTPPASGRGATTWASGPSARRCVGARRPARGALPAPTPS